MSGWHQTCAISQLPILNGEAARLLFLVRSPSGPLAGGCQTGHALWTPWGLPIAGVYGGHGTVKLTEGWQTRYVIERLEEVLCERSEGITPFDEPAVHKRDLKNDLDLKRFQQLVLKERVRVWADVDMTEAALLGLAVLREDVYLALANSPIQTPTGIFTVRGAIAQEMDRLKEYDANPLLTGELGDVLGTLQDTALGQKLIGSLKNMQRFARLAESVSSHGPEGYRGVGTHRVHVMEQVLRGVPKDNVDLLDEVQQFGAFLHVLGHFELMRKLWHPQPGVDSLRTGWNSHGVLARAVARVVEEQTQTDG